MSCGVYKITNLTNQKSYIGQAINIQDRWTKEKNKAFNPNSDEYNKTLSHAFRKYGIENFSFEILEECDVVELDEKEKYYIALFDSYAKGYNETFGGNNGNLGNCIKITKEQLLEIYDLLQNSIIPQKEIAKKYNVGQDVISTINHGKSRRMTGYSYPLRKNKVKYCPDCGAIISQQTMRCFECAKKASRKADRPDREKLKTLIRHIPFTKIGEQFGVSDNSIRKWCDSYNLPHSKKIINSYSDEEWQLI